MRVPFSWEEAGIDHWTGGDLMETLLLIGDQDEFDSFLTAYAEVCEDDDHAIHNIKYLAQLISTDSDNENALEEGTRIAAFLGLEKVPTETLSPRNWFSNSSLGVKVPA